MMSDTKFTRDVAVRKCKCGHPGCDQYIISTQRSSGLDLADANLYAAAPDMYDALEALAFWIEQGDFERMPMAAISGMMKARIAARAALTKARGEP